MQKRMWSPGTYSKEARTIQAVISTETEAIVYDFELREPVPEILLAAGAKWPDGGQVPFLDSHNRGTIGNVLGSCRDLRQEGDAVVGTIFFADDDQGRDVERKFSAGHISDVSVGYRSDKAVWIPEGESQIINGKQYDGPVKVVTAWTLKEVSAVVIGADRNARVRSEFNQKNEDTKMENTELNAVPIRQEERERVQEITAMCTRFDCENIGQRLVNDCSTVDQARKVVMDYYNKTKVDPALNFIPDTRYHVGITDAEKRSSAMVDGILLRSGIRLEKPAPGAGDFAGISLVDVARNCLEMSGKRVSAGTGSARIVSDALSMRAHSTSDFPYILANVAGKTLREAYRNTQSTFEAWTNQTDGRDFKEMSRTQLSEGPELLEIPELSEYLYGSFGESREVFHISTVGRMFAISRQAVINDDLNAFTRIPQAFSMSAKYGLNKAVYDALLANAAMADGYALFHANHGNYVGSGSGAAPGTTTLTAARLAMRSQTGIAGTVLNLTPQYLLVPAALETTADQLLNTVDGFDIADGPGRSNPFYKKLVPVVESLLDASSATGWYLIADPRMIDTIEVCFLQGQRTPYLETQPGWNVDGVEFKCRFDYGIKAIDWRGMFYNYGA